MERYNPQTDALIAANYTAGDLSGKVKDKAELQRMMELRQEPDTPILAVVSRLVSHKGLDLIKEVFHDIMRDIGKNICNLREQNKLTQEELAAKLFVTRQTVSNYEHGKTRPDMNMIMRIADVLNVDANAVFYGIPVPESRKTAFRRMMVSSAVLLMMVVGAIILHPLCLSLQAEKYITTPSFLMSMAEQIAPGLWRLNIPLVGNPLKNLNSFLIVGQRNLLIDTGFNQPACKEAMDTQLREIGADLGRTDLFMDTTQWGDGFTQDDYKALVSKMFDGTVKVSNDISAAQPSATNITVNFQGNIK